MTIYHLHKKKFLNLDTIQINPTGNKLYTLNYNTSSKVTEVNEFDITTPSTEVVNYTLANDTIPTDFQNLLDSILGNPVIGDVGNSSGDNIAFFYIGNKAASDENNNKSYLR